MLLVPYLFTNGQRGLMKPVETSDQERVGNRSHVLKKKQFIINTENKKLQEVLKFPIEIFGNLEAR